MSNAILILGESGSGKSRSIKNLPPKKTFIINVIGKDLPFRGWKNNYSIIKEDKSGNYFSSDNPAAIIQVMDFIDKERPDIEYIIIDDYVYSMSHEFMRRINETGFQKYNDIGEKAWKVIEKSKTLRGNLNVAILSHSEEFIDSNGVRRQKAKTIGKLVDNIINLEGMFTVVLYTDVEKIEDKMRHGFLTKNNGSNTAKAPDEMFEADVIPNDLKFVFDKIDEYNLS